MRTAVDTSQGFSTFVTGRYNPPGVAFPSINNADVVVSAGVRTGSPDNVFLRYDGGTVTVPYTTRDLTQPDINNHGEAIFYAADNHAIEDIHLFDDAGVHSVNELPNQEADLGESATLNDNGTIAYSYTFLGGLVVRDGATRHEYGPRPVPPGGGGLSLNNHGALALIDDLDPLHASIYTGAPGALERVITVGDALLGSTVTKLSYSREGFNDAGQIAFWATLADGRSVIVLADPVPEPGAVMAVAFPAAACVLRRRHRRPPPLRG